MIDSFENYHKDQLTIDLVKANIFGIAMFIPTVLIFVVPYYLVWGFTESLWPHKIESGAFVLFVLGIVLHELIHGITLSRFTSNGFKSIRFGVIWKMLTPYCHCKEPLKVKQYIIGSVMPALILGFLPGIIAIAIGNSGLLIFGIVFTVAACGDFMVINLLKKEDKDDYVLDHPTKPGCFIFRKN